MSTDICIDLDTDIKPFNRLMINFSKFSKKLLDRLCGDLAFQFL